MKCPLKFARYEFEGGEECIGAECGFFGSVCGSVDAHSKAQSTNTPTLSDLYGILSDANDDLASESVVTPEAVDANDANATQDSREKLEADVRDYYRIGLPGIQETELNRLYCKQVLEWLDRQVSITERHWMEIVGASANANVELKRQIDEQQAKVDELTEQLEAAHAKNRALKLHISKMQAGRHGWHVKGEELQQQVDELTAQLHASNAERARLRECMGIATDQAHDFLMLVDESGNVYDRDEGLA